MSGAYGDRLPFDLAAAGLTGVEGREHRLVAPGGVGWGHVQAGLWRLRRETMTGRR